MNKILKCMIEKSAKVRRVRTQNRRGHDAENCEPSNDNSLLLSPIQLKLQNYRLGSKTLSKPSAC